MKTRTKFDPSDNDFGPDWYVATDGNGISYLFHHMGNVGINHWSIRKVKPVFTFTNLR